MADAVDETPKEDATLEGDAAPVGEAKRESEALGPTNTTDAVDVEAGGELVALGTLGELTEGVSLGLTPRNGACVRHL